MNDTEELLTSYQIAVTEIRRALKEAGLSPREVNLQTINMPEFQEMLPEDAQNLFKEFKLRYILYLNQILKLSNREISRRIGGSSYVAIHELLKKFKETGNIKKVSMEDVSE